MQAVTLLILLDHFNHISAAVQDRLQQSGKAALLLLPLRRHLLHPTQPPAILAEIRCTQYSAILPISNNPLHLPMTSPAHNPLIDSDPAPAGVDEVDIDYYNIAAGLGSEIPVAPTFAKQQSMGLRRPSVLLKDNDDDDDDSDDNPPAMRMPSVAESPPSTSSRGSGDVRVESRKNSGYSRRISSTARSRRSVEWESITELKTESVGALDLPTVDKQLDSVGRVLDSRENTRWREGGQDEAKTGAV